MSVCGSFKIEQPWVPPDIAFSSQDSCSYSHSLKENLQVRVRET
jgi:hypothetical protein